LGTCNENGNWRLAYRASEDIGRLVNVPLTTAAAGLRLIPETTWGADGARVFAFKHAPQGAPWRDVVSRLSPEDLAPPNTN